MEAFELLETRASNPKLGAPAPDDDTLRRILQAALRAPDHQLLRPWRVWLVRGEARERLGAVLAEAQRRREPDASPQALDKTRSKPLRAPLIIVVAAVHKPHPKVPAIEQVLSAGALAQNVCLGLHAAGFAGIWRTGDPAYDPYVKQAFGLGEDAAIVGFIYAGTPTQPAPSVPRPSVDDVVGTWEG